MKKTVLALIIAATSLIADNKMSVSMHKMESGLSKIQKGYLYSSKALIIDGLDELYEGNKLFKEADMKSHLPKGKQNLLNRALGYSNGIDMNQAKMKNDILQSKFYDALNNTGSIIKNCVACHKIVRKW